MIGNEVGLPTGSNRSYLSVYSPFAITGATVDGRPVQLLAEREFGRLVYSTYIDITPKTTAKVVLDLEGAVDLSSGRYRFDGFSQVLPNTDVVHWTLHVGAGARVAGVTSTPGFAGTSGRSRAAVETDDAPVAWSVDVTLRR